VRPFHSMHLLQILAIVSVIVKGPGRLLRVPLLGEGVRRALKDGSTKRVVVEVQAEGVHARGEAASPVHAAAFWVLDVGFRAQGGRWRVWDSGVFMAVGCVDCWRARDARFSGGPRVWSISMSGALMYGMLKVLGAEPDGQLLLANLKQLDPVQVENPLSLFWDLE
jgi:hypothetical protein